jgi:hypothetical protein
MVDIEKLAERALDLLRARESATVGELAKLLGVAHLEGRLALELLEERRVGYFTSSFVGPVDVDLFLLYQDFRQS